MAVVRFVKSHDSLIVLKWVYFSYFLCFSVLFFSFSSFIKTNNSLSLVFFFWLSLNRMDPCRYFFVLPYPQSPTNCAKLDTPNRIRIKVRWPLRGYWKKTTGTENLRYFYTLKLAKIKVLEGLRLPGSPYLKYHHQSNWISRSRYPKTGLEVARSVVNISTNMKLV